MTKRKAPPPKGSKPAKKAKYNAFAMMMAKDPLDHTKSVVKKIRKGLDGKCRNYLTCMEFCAGGGGLALGLKRAGFRKVALVDLLPVAAQSLTGNFSTDLCLLANLLDITPIKEGFTTLDVLCAGLPCQSFSLLGRRAGFSDEKKGSPLWEGFINIVNGLQPKIVMVENVSPCMNDISKQCPEILELFKEAGYRVTAQVLDSNDLGVPQARKRMILICINQKLPVKDFNWHYISKVKKKLTFGDVFKGPWAKSQPAGEMPVAPCTTLGSTNVDDVIKHIPPGGWFCSLPQHLQESINYELGLSLRPKDLRRPHPDRPCPTITTSGGATAGWGCILSPYDPRCINIIEAGRVQTFPDDHYWGFEDNHGDQLTKDIYFQIGNAVPCNMGERIGWAFNRFLAECAKMKPKCFEAIPGDDPKTHGKGATKWDGSREQWMHDHVRLENSKDKKMEIERQQFRGSFWRISPDYSTQDAQKPRMLDFCIDDEVDVHYWNGKKEIKLNGLVKNKSSAKAVQFKIPDGREVVAKIQSQYLKSKNKEPHITGITHYQYPMGLNVVRLGFNHLDGKLMVTVRREYSGRLFTYTIPVAIANKNAPFAKDRNGHTVKQIMKQRGMTEDKISSKTTFTPLLRKVVGHPYPDGTIIEINQVNKAGLLTRHWSTAKIVGSGTNKFGDQYRKIQFFSKKVIPHELRSLVPDDCIIQANVSSAGHFRMIGTTITLKCRPAAEACDAEEFIGDGVKDNKKDRDRIIDNIKLLCVWKQALDGQIKTNIARNDMPNHTPNLNFGMAEVRLIEDLKQENMSYSESPAPGSCEFGILTKHGQFERIKILQLEEHMIEFAWKDGKREALKRSGIVFSHLGPVPAAEEGEWAELCENNVREARRINRRVTAKTRYTRQNKQLNRDFDAGNDTGGGRYDDSEDEDAADNMDDGSDDSDFKMAEVDEKPKKKKKKKYERRKSMATLAGHNDSQDLPAGCYPAPKASVHIFDEHVRLSPWQVATWNHDEIVDGIEDMQWKDYERAVNKKEVQKDGRRCNMKEWGVRPWGMDDEARHRILIGNHSEAPFNWGLGQRFQNRLRAYFAGVHREVMRGISVARTEKVCESICFAGGYADDTEDMDCEDTERLRFPDILEYTGEGMPEKGDQRIESKGNWGLNVAMKKEIPVRILVKRLKNPKRKGDGFFYEYIGLYEVTNWRLEQSEHSMQKVIKFDLKRSDDNQGIPLWKPDPNKPEDAEFIGKMPEDLRAAKKAEQAADCKTDVKKEWQVGYVAPETSQKNKLTNMFGGKSATSSQPKKKMKLKERPTQQGSLGKPQKAKPVPPAKKSKKTKSKTPSKVSKLQKLEKECSQLKADLETKKTELEEATAAQEWAKLGKIGALIGKLTAKHKTAEAALETYKKNNPSKSSDVPNLKSDSAEPAEGATKGRKKRKAIMDDSDDE